MTPEQIEEIEKHYKPPFRFNHMGFIVDSKGFPFLSLMVESRHINTSVESQGDFIAELLNREIGGDGETKEENDKLKEREEWVDIDRKLPSCKNGHIDSHVLVRVRNKNKSDGIWLYDVCSFDGESWGDRLHTWETITHWKPIN